MVTGNSPFLTSDRAWQLLVERCKCLAETLAVGKLRHLIETLSNATTEARTDDTSERFQRLTRAVCDIVRRRWDESQRALKVEDLEAYENASVLLSPLPPIPESCGHLGPQHCRISWPR